MIKLFITDLDGCVTDPFTTPDWDAFSKIRELNLESQNNPLIPPLTICTGRPMPYAEAMAQILGIELPFIFESGGGMYDVIKNDLIWNPCLSQEREAEIQELKKWGRKIISDKYPSSIAEFAKHTDIGFINPDTSIIEHIFKEAEELIGNGFEAFEVHSTPVSVNIILKDANKGKGIRMLCEYLGLDLEEVAYIGDSSGDVPGLKIVKAAFAPSNAAKVAKDVAEVVQANSTEGVLEAYRKIIERNKAL